QRNAQFDSKYASLASSFVADPNYQALVTGLAAANIPTPLANAQEASYIVAIRSTTGSVPEPPYITNLPPDQQSWLRGFHQQLAPAAPTSSAISTTSSGGVLPPVASVNGSLVMPSGNATQILNGTPVAVDPLAGNPTPTAEAVVPASPSVTVGAGNGTNGTSGAMRLGEGRGGLLGMVAMSFVGVVGIMVML
ncbi:MAG: hypothetical protein Q9199_003086, partial [Rusavskia elegans]